MALRLSDKASVSHGSGKGTANLRAITAACHPSFARMGG
jgi:hypothetical protein